MCELLFLHRCHYFTHQCISIIEKEKSKLSKPAKTFIANYTVENASLYFSRDFYIYFKNKLNGRFTDKIFYQIYENPAQPIIQEVIFKTST